MADTYIVSVETADGSLVPIKYGAMSTDLTSKDAGQMALAAMLSAGIGRHATHVETILGTKEAKAIVVSSLSSGRMYSYVDGRLQHPSR